MNEDEIKQLLASGLPGCDIELQSEGNKISVLVVGDLFEGLSRVKRQQLIYGLLNEKIGSGEIHAVSMRCLTQIENSSQG
ncbi:MAG: BolA/IbaG family iron-sulfur metabolism protein [Pseudomonadales bacterium]|nr:BolA/IbaG family iron-sulfur metabolism protein [Pseudomonadales bacterium]